MSNQSGASKKSIFSGNSKILIVFITIFAVFGLFYLFQTSAAPRSTSVDTNAVRLYISPSSTSVNQNNLVTLDVRMNSLTKAVNAVNAELSYPADKFEFVSIDSSASPLDFKLTEAGGNGVITIARGTTASVTGDVLVGKVTLKALQARGKGQIAFTGQSAIVEAGTAVNILQQTYGSTVTFKR